MGSLFFSHNDFLNIFFCGRELSAGECGLAHFPGGDIGWYLPILLFPQDDNYPHVRDDNYPHCRFAMGFFYYCVNSLVGFNGSATFLCSDSLETRQFYGRIQWLRASAAVGS